MVDLGLLKSGKVEMESTIDQGNLTLSWDILQKVHPHREEPLLGGNAHSARYGELIPDRSGKPVSVDHQEQAKITKNQLADILTEVNFTRDERNHLLCLFNISHFSSAECSEVTSKRTQKIS